MDIKAQIQQWIAMSEAFGGRNPKSVGVAETDNNEYEPTAKYVLLMLNDAGLKIVEAG